MSLEVDLCPLEPQSWGGSWGWNRNGCLPCKSNLFKVRLLCHFKVMFVSSKDKKRKITATKAFEQTNFGFAVFLLCTTYILLG